MRPRYATPLTWNWFLQRPGFRFFMLREFTSFFIAVYLVFFLLWLRSLGQGLEAYADFMKMVRHPISWAVNTIIFGAALYHSVTWFNLTPKVMPIQLGEDRVADAWTAFLMGYAPWFALSAFILWWVAL